MITIQTQGETFVGTGDGELYFPSAGSWSVSNVTYVSWRTNADVTLGVLRDGATVSIDGSGIVSVVDGPDLIGASVAGFVLALSTLGVMLGIKFVFRKALGGASLSSSVD